MPKEKFKKKRSDRRANPLSAESRAQMIQQVRNLAEPLCEAEGVELVHIEYQRESSGRILRVYIDKPGGIRLDDCVRISRQLNDILDVYLENDLAYNLEVSSPGSDRPLGRKEDFDRFKDHQASVKTLNRSRGGKISRVSCWA